MWLVASQTNRDHMPQGRVGEMGGIFYFHEKLWRGTKSQGSKNASGSRKADVKRATKCNYDTAI